MARPSKGIPEIPVEEVVQRTAKHLVKAADANDEAFRLAMADGSRALRAHIGVSQAAISSAFGELAQLVRGPPRFHSPTEAPQIDFEPPPC